MPWYRAGTVSVTLNNTTVTGTGTAFAANSRVGDAFLGPDGRWYEVANIASDTVLSILPAYQGATAAAGTYALAPIQGYVKASADQLRSIVSSFGDKMAALGTTGNYDTLPVDKGGTGLTTLAAFIQTLLGATDQAAARAAIGAITSKLTTAMNGATPVSIASAATVDVGAAAANDVTITGTVAITSLGTIASGARRTLTFAGTLTLTHNTTSLILPGAANIVTAAGDVAEVESLGGGNWKCLGYFRAAELPDLVRSVAQGGTGVTSMAALLVALNALGNYAKTNIIGTVSQSSGIPTGAIIETGTNSNGTYTKYADGTLVCSGISSASVITNTVGGNVFHSSAVTFTFPAPFVGSVPKICHGSLTTTQYYSWTAMEGGINASLTATALRLVSPVNGATGYICYSAIGRWF